MGNRLPELRKPRTEFSPTVDIALLLFFHLGVACSLLAVRLVRRRGKILKVGYKWTTQDLCRHKVYRAFYRQLREFFALGHQQRDNFGQGISILGSKIPMGGRLQYKSVFAVTLVFLLESSVSADKPVTIPLDQIWANRMPGTKEISLLVEQEPRLTGISNALGFPPKDGEAKPAFAVQGRGLEALREAHVVIVDKKKPRDTFSAGKEVSVVFFTHETGPYVHLQKVECQGTNINIYYKFVPHEEEETERYIALIPLGKLAGGKYSLNIIRSPDAGSRLQKVSDEYAQRVVCRPFSFTVSEQGD